MLEDPHCILRSPGIGHLLLLLPLQREELCKARGIFNRVGLPLPILLFWFWKAQSCPIFTSFCSIRSVTWGFCTANRWQPAEDSPGNSRIWSLCAKDVPQDQTRWPEHRGDAHILMSTGHLPVPCRYIKSHISVRELKTLALVHRWTYKASIKYHKWLLVRMLLRKRKKYLQKENFSRSGIVWLNWQK